MKTWEMIKELTEHPEKKFKCTNYDWLGEEYPHQLQHDTVICNGGKVHLDNASSSVLKLSFATMQAKWEEVIEQVDFLTAYNDCLENGTEYKCYTQTMYRSKESGLVIILCKTGHSNAVLCNEWKKVSNDNN